MASDIAFRADVLTQAERKPGSREGARLHVLLRLGSPVEAGKLRTFHTLEIPFVFDNVDIAESMTGSGPERQALANKISNAWVAFARTGNPNHKGMPNWPSFNNAQRATMILNNECKVVNDPNGPERLALRSARAAS